MAVTLGTKVKLSNYPTNNLGPSIVDKFSDTKFIAMYINGYVPYAKVGDISGSTITYGSAQVVGADSYGYAREYSLCTLDSTHFIAIWHNNNGSRYDVRCGTVSGTTVTMGTVNTVSSGSSARLPFVIKMSSTQVVFGYNNGTDSYVRVGNISGTDITFGTAVKVYTGAYNLIGTQLSSSKFVVGNGEKNTLYIGDVSSSTITLGSAQSFTTNNVEVWKTSLVQVDTNKFVVCFNDTSNTLGKAVICSVSGTTVSTGTEVELCSGTLQRASFCTGINSTKCLLFYGHPDTNYTTCKVGTINDTSLTLSDETTIASYGLLIGSAINLDTTSKTIICFQDQYDDGGGGQAGWSLVGTIPIVVGPATLKTINGLTAAQVKAINGLEIGKTKTINGLS